MLTNIKLPKMQISKTIQCGGCLGSLLSKRSVSTNESSSSIVKNRLALLGIAAAAFAIDAESQKKINGSGTITLIISNEEMNDIMKIV